MAQKYQFGRKKESGHDVEGARPPPRKLPGRTSRQAQSVGYDHASLPDMGGRWQVVGSVLWGEEDSDVGLHGNELFMVTLGAMYRFGAR